MKRLDISFKELLEQSGKLTFLVGAGCSADPPSNLPLGREMIKAIVKYTCAESEVEKILSIKNLRFERIVIKYFHYRLLETEMISFSFDPKYFNTKTMISY
ncbi:MAG: hypothetical protein ACFFAS_11870 [Promethearchaeota archaeon]